MYFHGLCAQYQSKCLLWITTDCGIFVLMLQKSLVLWSDLPRTFPLQTDRTFSTGWPVSSWNALQRFISWSQSFIAPPSLVLSNTPTTIVVLFSVADLSWGAHMVMVSLFLPGLLLIILNQSQETTICLVFHLGLSLVTLPGADAPTAAEAVKSQLRST